MKKLNKLLKDCISYSKAKRSLQKKFSQASTLTSALLSIHAEVSSYLCNHGVLKVDKN